LATAVGAAAEGEMMEEADRAVLSDGMEVERVSLEELEVGDFIGGMGLDEAPERIRAAATTLAELFMIHGVDAETARAKVAELYSPPRVTRELGRVRSLHLTAGSTFDLVADASGKVWNKAATREGEAVAGHREPALHAVLAVAEPQPGQGESEGTALQAGRGQGSAGLRLRSIPSAAGPRCAFLT
jgi:hypothetical protein